MADIAFPTLGHEYADSLEVSIISNQTGFTSPLNATTAVVELPGSRWAFSLTFDKTTVSDGALLSAWLVSLRGMANRALLHNFYRPTPRGTIAGTPLVNGGSQTGTTLNIDGVTNGTTLLRGDWVGFSQGTVNAQLVMVTADVTASGGAMAVSIFPEIRTSPSDNSAIVTTKPVGRFRLATPEAKWRPQVVGYTDFALDFVEAFS